MAKEKTKINDRVSRACMLRSVMGFIASSFASP